MVDAWGALQAQPELHRGSEEAWSNARLALSSGHLCAISDNVYSITGGDPGKPAKHLP